jgi:hypothetical protein
VTQNAAKYTKREVRDAAAARELMRNPTSGDMCERLRIGKIKNVTVTPSDVWRSIAIWGKSGASIKGKTTTHKAPVVKFERLPVDDVQKQQELQVDLIFVDKVAFLLGVLIPMKYTFLAPLASRAQSAIWPALKRFILLPRSRGITVDIVRTDPEGGVVSSESELAELGCELNPVARRKQSQLWSAPSGLLRRGSEASLTRCPIPCHTASSPHYAFSWSSG